MPNFNFGAGITSNPMDAYNEMSGMVKQSRLAKLLGQGYNAPKEQRSGLLSQIAELDPQAAQGMDQRFASLDERAAKQLQEYARITHGAWKSGNRQAAESMYGRALELAKQVYPGFEAGPLDDATAEMLGQFAGVGSAVGVQSTYVDDRGQRVAIMRDGSVQVLGNNAPQNQIIDTGNGFYGVNKGNLRAAPVQVGGPAPSAPQPGGQFAIDPNLPPEVQASIRANEGMWANASEEAPIEIGGGGQLRSVPKPQEAMRMQMDAERLRLAQEAAQRAGNADARSQAEFERRQSLPNAQQVKLATRAQGEKRLLDSARREIEETESLVNSILSKSDNFGGVTGMGALGARIPGSLWADIAADIDRLRGRSAFSALQEMRANSPTGGALGSITERELALLQNAETALQGTQSPEKLKASLQDYLKQLRNSRELINRRYAESYAPGNFQQQPAATGGFRILPD